MDLYRGSSQIIRRSQHRAGAYVASPTFPTYRYSWIRDGAFVAYAMDQAQAHESAHAFHRWTSRTVLQQQSKIAALEAEPETPLDDRTTLHARFTAEGTEGTE